MAFDAPAPEPADPLDPALYPRTYRASRGDRIGAYALAALLGAAAVAAVCGGIALRADAGATTALVAVGLLLAGAAIAVVVDTRASRVVLTADAVQVHQLGPTRRMRRDGVAGRRLVEVKGRRYLVLEPRRRDLGKLRVPLALDTDAAFGTWFAGLPDLDRQELERSVAELEAQRRPGESPERHARRLASARRLAKGLNVAAGASMAWGVLFPAPYRLAVAAVAAVPVLAILAVARSGGLLRLDDQRNDAAPTLAFALIGPGAVLALRALSDVHVLDWQKALTCALALGAATTVAACGVDRRLRRRAWKPLLLVPLLAMHGYGATAEGNALLDRSRPEVFQARVLSKHVSHGKHTSYDLQLAPWGPRPDAAEVEVSRRTYDAARVGGEARVALFRGALGIRWYVVRVSPPAPR